MVASVLQRAGEAAHSVDDLAESLAIFDLKLRHMREVSVTLSGLEEPFLCGALKQLLFPAAHAQQGYIKALQKLKSCVWAAGHSGNRGAQQSAGTAGEAQQRAARDAGAAAGPPGAARADRARPCLQQLHLCHVRSASFPHSAQGLSTVPAVTLKDPLGSSDLAWPKGVCKCGGRQHTHGLNFSGHMDACVPEGKWEVGALCRLPSLAEAGWDVWERLAALEPADGKHATGQLEPGLAGMTAVVEQRNRLQASCLAVNN